MTKYYHYTKKNIIESINNNKKIWFSNVMSYNKTRFKENIELFIEPYYFQAVKELKEEYPEERFIVKLPDKYPFFDKYLKKGFNKKENKTKYPLCLKSTLRFVDSKSIEYQDIFYIDYDYETYFNCYVFCMSTDKDNDYLKKYYGQPNINPIEINVEKLKQNYIKQLKIAFLKSGVLKQSDKQEIILSSELRLVLGDKGSQKLETCFFREGELIYKKSEKLIKIKKYIKNYNDLIKSEKISNLDRYLDLLMYELFVKSLFFKEDGFELEKEYRIVFLCPIDLESELSPNNNIEIGEKIAIDYD